MSSEAGPSNAFSTELTPLSLARRGRRTTLSDSERILRKQQKNRERQQQYRMRTREARITAAQTQQREIIINSAIQVEEPVIEDDLDQELQSLPFTDVSIEALLVNENEDQPPSLSSVPDFNVVSI